jgi:hypothetical protein
MSNRGTIRAALPNAQNSFRRQGKTFFDAGFLKG